MQYIPHKSSIKTVFLLFFICFFEFGCDHTSNEILDGFWGGIVPLLITSLVLGFIFTAIEDRDFREILLLISVLISLFGIGYSVNEIAKNESPETLWNRWEKAHPGASLASDVLKFRQKNHLCAVCGKYGKWSTIIFTSSEEKFTERIDTTVRSPIKKMEFSCDEHVKYLDLKSRAARDYLVLNYSGPARNQIGYASLKGPKPLKSQNIVGILSGNVSHLVIFLPIFLFCLYKLTNVSDRGIKAPVIELPLVEKPPKIKSESTPSLVEKTVPRPAFTKDKVLLGLRNICAKYDVGKAKGTTFKLLKKHYDVERFTRLCLNEINGWTINSEPLPKHKRIPGLTTFLKQSNYLEENKAILRPVIEDLADFISESQGKEGNWQEKNEKRIT